MLIRGLFMLGLLIWAWKTTAWPVLIALVFLWMQNEALAHLTTGTGKRSRQLGKIFMPQ